MEKIGKGLRAIAKGILLIADEYDPRQVSEKQVEASKKNLQRANEVKQKTLELEVQLFTGIEGVKLNTQELWVKTYDDREWIQLELNKANVWISANPQKAPKSQFARFYSSWLGRAWEQHRKGISGSPGGPKSYNERMVDKYQEWYGD